MFLLLGLIIGNNQCAVGCGLAEDEWEEFISLGREHLVVSMPSTTVEAHHHSRLKAPSRKELTYKTDLVGGILLRIFIWLIITVVSLVVLSVSI